MLTTDVRSLIQFMELYQLVAVMQFFLVIFILYYLISSSQLLC